MGTHRTAGAVARTAGVWGQISSLRTILVTGKGGVGKTSVTASIARALAASGKRVLCGEVASAAEETSALAKALGADRATLEPISCGERLDLVVLDPSRGHAAFLRDVLPMRMLAEAAMRSQPIRRFLGAAPALPEMGVLYRILELLREKGRDGDVRYDTVVVDLPATGHALALAQIPGTLLEILPGGPIVDAVKEGLEILRDPTRTGAVVVTLPETLPVSEALELLTGIAKHSIPVKGVVLNRMPHDPFTREELEAVTAHAPRIPEVLGTRSVARIGRSAAALARLEEHGTDVLLLPDLPGFDEVSATLSAHFRAGDRSGE
ncbi:MAG: ArsA family ATPase [Myxococcales bacterium]|nr:ArsA family ATPase [Myxococcales bacterium]